MLGQRNHGTSFLPIVTVVAEHIIAPQPSSSVNNDAHACLAPRAIPPATAHTLTHRSPSQILHGSPWPRLTNVRRCNEQSPSQEFVTELFQTAFTCGKNPVPVSVQVSATCAAPRHTSREFACKCVCVCARACVWSWVACSSRAGIAWGLCILLNTSGTVLLQRSETPQPHTIIHTHARAHTHTYTHTHTRAHTHILALMRSQEKCAAMMELPVTEVSLAAQSVHAYTHERVHMHACKHARTHARTHACTPHTPLKGTNTHSHETVLPHVRDGKCTLTHTPVLTRTHPSTHTTRCALIANERARARATATRACTAASRVFLFPLFA